MRLCYYTYSICKDKQYTAERTKHKCISVTSYPTFYSTNPSSYGISAKNNAIIVTETV